MIYRVKQLSAEIGVKENTLRTAIKRGTLDAPGGRLDIFKDQNRRYIEKRAPRFYSDKIELEQERAAADLAHFTEVADAVRAEPAALMLDTEVDEKERGLAEKFKKAFREQELKEEKLEWDIKVKIQDEELKKQRAELNRVQRQKLRGELLPLDWVIRTNSEAVGMYKKMVRQTARTAMRQIMDEYKVKPQHRAEYETALDAGFEALQERYEAKLRDLVNTYTLDENEKSDDESAE